MYLTLPVNFNNIKATDPARKVAIDLQKLRLNRVYLLNMNLHHFGKRLSAEILIIISGLLTVYMLVIYYKLHQAL